MFLSLLWHHHQPVYRHPETQKYLLPWVNYHITKNYYQMATLAEEMGYPCTMNLVPCLIDQMEDYATGRAADPWQTALEEKPENLTSVQISELAKFLPPSAGDKRAADIQLAVLQAFFSPLFPTTDSKEEWLWRQQKVKSEIIPYFRRLWKDHRIEVMTSAYYHPLLPLIFDLSVGGEVLMPGVSFSHPEDGITQIAAGRAYVHEVFGEAPRGFWPSEGGLSAEVASAIAAEGFSFAVTDENVLWKSLKQTPDPKKMETPYLCGGLTVFFRDRELSDLIGFEYHRWDERDAVSHFLAKIADKHRDASEEAICVIALDGENPWAGYRENGIPFLRELYSRLKTTPGLVPIFFGDYLSLFPAKTEINLVPGTWLGSFAKWVGSPAKNSAWERLARTRQRSGPCEDIYIAEGSDWFWWFGEQGVSEFAALFEAYLASALRKRKEKIPR